MRYQIEIKPVNEGGKALAYLLSVLIVVGLLLAMSK